MTCSLKLTLAIASAFGMATAASAQGSTPAAPAQAAKPADPMSQIVCQKQEIVGSRLASRRVCMTRAQWQEQRAIDRQDTEKAQTPAAQNTPQGWGGEL